MSALNITADWIVTTPLHIGTGAARAGFIDALVRHNAGRAEIPGDAVKGAIRQSAERLTRWVCSSLPPEIEKHSEPAHPVLRRIFAPDMRRSEPPAGARYRFRKAICEDENQRRFLAASTAICEETGVAKAESLRIFEHWARGLEFHIEVEVRGGNWANSPNDTFSDRLDLQALSLAILLTDSIGGKRGTGCGSIECRNFHCEVPCLGLVNPCEEDTVGRVREYLAATGGQHAA